MGEKAGREGEREKGWGRSLNNIDPCPSPFKDIQHSSYN